MVDAPTALASAIRDGDAESVRAALASGADPGSSVRTKLVWHDEVPVLVLAAFLGEPSVVYALLEAGAYINATCTDYQCHAFSDDDVATDGQGALAAAAGEGHEEVVCLLLARGADPDVSHPLIYAAGAGHLAIVRRLVRAGASLRQRDGDFHSAMYYAARAGHLEILDWLCTRGACFHRRIDLREAKKQSGKAVRAWFSRHRERDLLEAQYSWWSADLARDDLDEAFRAVMSAIAGTEIEWSPVEREESEELHPYGADWYEVRRTTTRTLGPYTVRCIETVERARHAPNTVRSERTHFEGPDVPIMSWVHTLEGPVEPTFVGLCGGRAALDAFDQALETGRFEFSLQKRADDDSEYAARARLRQTSVRGRDPTG